MNRIEKAAVINYPFHPDASEGSGLYTAAIARQSAFRAGYEQGAIEFGEWLSHPECVVVLVDGDYYYRDDEDGDQTLTTTQVFGIFKNEAE